MSSTIDLPTYTEITLDELLPGEEYKANVKYTLPLTCGMEIEQPDQVIDPRLRRYYEWHYDGSGPLETALPPSVNPITHIKRFIDIVNELNARWEWVNEFYTPGRWRGCGSHIHFRVRDDLEHPVPIEDVWATTYNTFIEVYPFILPLFAFGNREVYTFRREVLTWADIIPTRLSPELMRDYLREDYESHPYHAIALNRKTREKPLTIEIRLAETHPAIAYYVMLIMNRIVREVYKRGYLSPKLDPTIRNSVYMKVENAIDRSTEQRIDLYDALEEEFMDFEIRFTRPIPRLKSVYYGYFSIFKDILKHYTTMEHDREARVYLLFINKGRPARNAMRLWDIFAPKGLFEWIDPPIKW